MADIQDTPKPSKTPGTSRRGFASLSPERRRELARLGGAAVPDEKRSFSQNADLAREAGRKGGARSQQTRRGEA